ncbi:MAG: lysophospholipid acyltransferase family protein [Planctomycetota bacterium]
MASTLLKTLTKLLTPVAAFCLTAILWLIFRTLKIKLICGTPDTSPYNRKCTDRFIYSVWHDSMIMPVFGGRHWCTTALTSQHRDGSFVANVLRFRNIRFVRGSTNRIRTGAIRELLQSAESCHLVLTPDGPRGPSRNMSRGIAYLASRTGRGVVPTAFACSHAWRLRGSWSDLIIPKPFATVVLRAGDPIHCPPDADANELREQQAKLQAAMDQMDREAHAKLPQTHSRVESSAQPFPPRPKAHAA